MRTYKPHATKHWTDAALSNATADISRIKPGGGVNFARGSQNELTNCNCLEQ